MSSLLSTEWPPLTILTTSGSKMKTFKRITNMCCLLMFFFFFETKWQNWAKLQSFSFSFYEPKVWNTLGDTLLQHVNDKSLVVYRSSNKLCDMLQQQTFICTGEFLWKSLSRQQNFVIEQIASDLNLCDLLQGQNSLVETRVFTKFSRTHKEFVIWLQSVAAMCWCNLSPSVFCP